MKRLFGAVFVSALWACSEVRLEPASGGGGSGGAPETGGGGQAGEAPVCAPLPGVAELGCVERNNPIVSVQAEVDDENYLSYLALARDEGVSGHVCGSGQVTLGTGSIDAATFPASSCFRLSADAALSTVDVIALPEALQIFDTLSEGAANDGVLVLLPPGSSHDGFTAGDRGLVGVLQADGSLPWMRALFEGTATDALIAFEHPLLLANGDVAISVLLGASGGGSVDFGGGFTFEDDGQGTTAYLARLDASTGETRVAFAIEVAPEASHVVPLEGADGSFTALLLGSPEGSTEWWARWFDLDGPSPTEIASIDEVSPGSHPLVDGAGRLWFNQWEGEGGIRVVDRAGGCFTAKEFEAGPALYAQDLTLLPTGNLAVLLRVYGERELDGCGLADAEGDGDLFAAELSAQGDWLRVVRLSTGVPAGARLLDATQDDLVVYFLEGDESGFHTQRVERIDWGEAAF